MKVIKIIFNIIFGSFKKCTAPNITYCKLVINKIDSCNECKWFRFRKEKIKKIEKIIKEKFNE